MNITSLINHPEKMDRDTLYELRSILATYPCYQTARLLMLQNLYLLHDPTFDEELRRAAIYITDRKVIFKMIEAVHYHIRRPGEQQLETALTQQAQTPAAGAATGDRTISLIDTFLDSIPRDGGRPAPAEKQKRQPTAADAAIDYVSYLMENETPAPGGRSGRTQMRGQDLIDNFIENDRGKIVLNDTPEFTPQLEESGTAAEKSTEQSYFTETLSRIYIKQGRYDKALEIIKRLSLNNPKKNAYFADQIRFLEKLIINNNKK